MVRQDPLAGARNTGYADEEKARRQHTPRPAARPEKWTRDDGAREWDDTTPTRRTPRTKAATAAPAKGRASKAGSGSGRAAPKTSMTGAAAAGSAGAALAALSPKRSLPADVAADIRKAADVATAAHRERLVEKAESAFGAFERGRFQDALRAIKPVVDEAPQVAEVREVAGLAAYRAGRWRDAIRHLRAFGDLTDSSEHLPVLMDCQRAQGRPKKVVELWSELRQSSPEPDVLAEGRIVAAASLADGGDLQGAIAMLSTAGATKTLRNPSERHIRQWYLLADLYERAGDVPRAREYFERVQRAEPDAYDVLDRLRGLGPERRPRSPRRSTSAPSPKKA